MYVCGLSNFGAEISVSKTCYLGGGENCGAICEMSTNTLMALLWRRNKSLSINRIVITVTMTINRTSPSLCSVSLFLYCRELACDWHFLNTKIGTEEGLSER